MQKSLSTALVDTEVDLFLFYFFLNKFWIYYISYLVELIIENMIKRMNIFLLYLFVLHSNKFAKYP